MATAKKAAPKTAVKKTVTKQMSVLKPIKETFNKTTLVAHLVEASGAEPKTVKAVLGSLEEAILASLSKKGAGEFTWPGVFKVAATHVPAKRLARALTHSPKSSACLPPSPHRSRSKLASSRRSRTPLCNRR